MIEALTAIIGKKTVGVELYADPLASAMEWQKITAGERAAMFLANVIHESGELTRIEENLHYSATRLQQVWPNRFPSAVFALEYANRPEAIASLVYANRMGNGNEASKDGWKYRGRGLIQLTGKTNYAAFSADCFGDNRAVDDPDLLLEATWAASSAAWFWGSRQLNKTADNHDFNSVVKRINGGLIGMADRRAYYERACKYYGIKGAR